MKHAKAPLFDGVQDEVENLWADARGLAEARWRLLRLELAAARDQVTRLIVIFATAAVATLISLPVLLVALADALDGTFGISRIGWLALGGGGLLLGAIAAALLAWRKFRRDFCGLAESLEEVREDPVWLRERRAPRENAQ